MKFLLLLVLAIAVVGSGYVVQRPTGRINNHPIRDRYNYYKTNNDKQYYKQEYYAVTADSATVGAINKAAIKAIAKLLSTCGVGVYASRIGLLNQQALSVLSKLIFSLLQPCLLFVNVSTVVSKLESSGGIASVSMLLGAAAFQIMVGYALGKVLSKLVYGRKSSESSRQLIACSTFSNSGPLPFVFVDSLFRSHPDPTLLVKSNAYISMYLLCWSPLFWIIAPAILTEAKPANTPEERAAQRKQLIGRILSPPVVGSILGMIVGSIPLLKRVLIASTGVLNPFYEALRTLGSGYLPAVLLVLAGSLAAPQDKADEETQTSKATLVETIKKNRSFGFQILTIYLAKFFFLPTLSFFLVSTARKYIPFINEIFSKNPLLLFILLLETCMPSAQNTTVILQLKGEKSAAGRLARVLMLIYVLGVPAITYWLVKILMLTGLAG